MSGTSWGLGGNPIIKNPSGSVFCLPTHEFSLNATENFDLTVKNELDHWVIGGGLFGDC
jgi:hypothetical protein